MRERVNVKSPVREYRPPGSVRGAPGNRCPYLDISQAALTVCILISCPYSLDVRITIDIEKTTLDDLLANTGEKKMSLAVNKALTEFVRRQKARQFGRMLREGAFDYEPTNEQIEHND